MAVKSEPTKLWNVQCPVCLKLWKTPEHHRIICSQECRDVRFPGKTKHGTLQCYNYHKCRCDVCVKANREYHRAWRKAQQ